MIRHWSLQRLFLDLDCLDFVDFSRRSFTQGAVTQPSFVER
jgi:hypothetical protein